MQLNSFVRLTNDFIVCVGGPQRPTSFTNGRGRRATTTATLQYCTAPPGGGTAFDCTFLVGHSPLPSFSRRCSGLDSRVSRDKTHLSRIARSHFCFEYLALFSCFLAFRAHFGCRSSSISCENSRSLSLYRRARRIAPLLRISAHVRTTVT